MPSTAPYRASGTKPNTRARGVSGRTSTLNATKPVGQRQPSTRPGAVKDPARAHHQHNGGRLQNRPDEPGVRSENGKYSTLSYKSMLIASRLGQSKTAVGLDNLSRLLSLTGNRGNGPKTVQKTCSPIKVQENRPTRWKNCTALVAYRSRKLGRNSPSAESFSLTCCIFRFLRGPLPKGRFYTLSPLSKRVAQKPT